MRLIARATLPLLAALLVVPAIAGPPKKKPTPKLLPTDRATLQKLVSANKLPAFYDPKDLSKPPIISAPSAILVDAETGQVLWSKNPDQKMFPASTTKIMTGWLFAERTKPEDIITCLDPSVTKIEESSLHIKPWEKFKSQDLLRGFMLRSGNDAAVVMAEYIAGTVPKFADLMNARAKELGATNTHFVTPNGLHDPQHYSTARDLAKIACAAMKNPRFAEAVADPSVTIERSINKTDSVITAKVKKYWYDKFPGADGVKTGYTRKAGHCFVGSATRDGRRLLAVVLKANDSASRDTIPIISWGFQRFPAVTVAKKGNPVGMVPITGGLSEQVPVVAANDLRATVDSLGVVVPPSAVAEVKPTFARAPVQRGQVVGRVVARVGSLEVGETDAIAAEDVGVAPIKAAFARGISVPWMLVGLCALSVLLIGWHYGAAAFAQGPRRRRGRIATARGGVNRRR
jgi:serine-type D-Ala-D-Ala carboxypeptidase (penicillin-binding protein 5/6)